MASQGKGQLCWHEHDDAIDTIQMDANLLQTLNWEMIKPLTCPSTATKFLLKWFERGCLLLLAYHSRNGILYFIKAKALCFSPFIGLAYHQRQESCVLDPLWSPLLA
jgi:hypothetical protein